MEGFSMLKDRGSSSAKGGVLQYNIGVIMGRQPMAALWCDKDTYTLKCNLKAGEDKFKSV